MWNRNDCSLYQEEIPQQNRLPYEKLGMMYLGRMITGDAGLPPVVSQNIDQLFFSQNVTHDNPRFQPWIAVEASVRFYNTKRNIDKVDKLRCCLLLDESFVRPVWDDAEEIEYTLVQAQPESAWCWYISILTILIVHRLIGKKVISENST